ncbi:GNAT family N-acetyltransferase [Serratia fonticola]|uniref:GNAT family N-acetyltransferase n=1 Tax=Serratia fonticola TaxID=47917 RepID=UPI0003AC7778|nr:GNAT family N-acetyltransferase [Serratia fonticola]ERK07265.1 Acetyltransferase, GNAT family [Serratia fonticola AU-P3(3)]MEB7887571.1 GNAT family N-acetyltransferase [Serratia fonticola]
MRLTTRQATLEEIYSLYLCIPEFGSLHRLKDLQQRIGDNPSHGLIAEIDGQAAGFKLGYQTAPGEFYSWLGAVLPDFRRQGIAQTMLAEQERWARSQGYQQLWVKTRNQFRAMLIMLISHEYQIFTLEKKGEVDEYRLLLKKNL